MPMYTYRREDGTTFDVRQKFTDDPLRVDPVTGQAVVRVVQAAGVIFKGSGFYINDSKSASRASATSTSRSDKADGKGESDAAKPEGKAVEAKPKEVTPIPKAPAAAAD